MRDSAVNILAIAFVCAFVSAVGTIYLYLVVVRMKLLGEIYFMSVNKL